MNEPREGLKGGLLVLDLDYTIADTERLLKYHVTAREAERPGLHEVGVFKENISKTSSC